MKRRDSRLSEKCQECLGNHTGIPPLVESTGNCDDCPYATQGDSGKGEK